MQVRIGYPTLGGALLNFPGLWHSLKWVLDWRGRYDAARAITSSGVLDLPPVVYFGLLIAGSLLIWWDTRRQRREIMIEVSPIAVAIIASLAFVAAWGWYFYDRSKGPIVWTWSDTVPLAFNGSPGNISIFGIQLKGYNRGDVPITPTDAFVESRIDGAKLPLTFSRTPIQKGIIPPEADFSLIAILPTDDSTGRRNEGVTVKTFREKFGSFRIVFESPQTKYDIPFERSAVEKLLIAGEKRIEVSPTPHVIIRSD